LGLFGLGFGVDPVRLSRGRRAVSGGRIRQSGTARLMIKCGGLDVLFSGEALAEAHDAAPQPPLVTELAWCPFARSARAGCHRRVVGRAGCKFAWFERIPGLVHVK